MSYIYARRKHLEEETPNTETPARQGPSLEALRSGAAAPTAEQMGRRVDLPDAMREKMESAFGADLSAVRLYESEAVGEAGANAVARGSSIAFAPGMLDFTSFGGQALLGHELSHVVSQARGEVTGGGFLNDASLEARADREGAMAAAGQTVSLPAAPLSPVTAAAAAGPMQADKTDRYFPAGIAGGMSPDFGDAKAKEIEAAEAAPAFKLDIPAGSASGMDPDFGDSLSDRLPRLNIPQGSGGGMFGDFGEASGETADRVVKAQEAKAKAEAEGTAPAFPGLHIPAGSGSGLFDDFGEASGEEADRYVKAEEAKEKAKAEGKAPAFPGLYIPAGSATGMDPEHLPQGYQWEFAPDKDTQLPDAEIGSTLGMKNLEDPKHGDQYQAMIEALNVVSDLRKRRADVDDLAYNAMMRNAQARAVSKMEEYRDQLKSEWGNFRERRRQVKYMDQMLAKARADLAQSEAQQTTALSGSEFTGTIHSGQINSVYRYTRKGRGGYFKPDSQKVDPNEHSVMDRIGIKHAGTMVVNPDTGEEEAYDPKLGNREVAYARLGSLLGTNVALGAKRATIGDDSLKGNRYLNGRALTDDDYLNAESDAIYSAKEFDMGEGQAGVLMDEASGKSWQSYNWDYFGLGTGEDGKAVSAMSVLPYRKSLTADGTSDLGTRLAQARGGLARKTTLDPAYQGRNMSFLGSERFGDQGGALNAADPDYQRQMNEMFLLDTLAAHTDRHSGNFTVDRDPEGKISVKAIDNDLTFGAFGDKRDAEIFGMQGSSQNYGGLPAQMQVDAKMAQKIGALDRKTLDLTFSDLLDEPEIDALWTRVELMKKYIGGLKKGMLVDEWNNETAVKEMLMAGGAGSADDEGKDPEHPFTGNNYYQRQMLMLMAAETGDATLLRTAAGWKK